MSVSCCSSSGISPTEYAKKLQEIDADRATKPKNSQPEQVASTQTPLIDTTRLLDILT